MDQERAGDRKIRKMNVFHSCLQNLNHASGSGQDRVCNLEDVMEYRGYYLSVCMYVSTVHT